MDLKDKISAALVIAALALIAGCICTPDTTPSEDKVDRIYATMDAAQMGELQGIIQSNQDNYTREKAVFALAELADATGKGDEAIGFLRTVAYNESNDDVRNAAYAKIRDLRGKYPLEVEGKLEIASSGTPSTGGKITISGVASATADVPYASFGIKRAVRIRNQSQPNSGVEPPRHNQHFAMKAGEDTQVGPIEIGVNEPGTYMIIGMLRMGIDRADYKDVEKTIYVNVEK